MRSTKKSVLRPVYGAVLLTVLLAGAVGCGGDKEFNVSEACGTKVDPELIRELLPEGDKLEIDDSLSDPDQPRCQLSVDGELTLYLRGDIVEPYIKPLEISADGMRRLGNPSPADIGDGATIADHGAMAVQACTHKGEKRQYVLAVDGVDNPKDTVERRRVLERFTRSYLPVAMEAEGCRP